MEAQLNIKLLRIAEDQKSILRQMFEFYCYDFSEYDQNDLNEHGFYGYKYLDYYWTEPDRHAFFIKVDGQYAGFVLVNKHTYFFQDSHAISEFFVMRKYRRLGIGKYAATKVFEMFPGKWEVSFYSSNKSSVKFWLNIIKSYTSGKYMIKDVESEDYARRVVMFG